MQTDVETLMKAWQDAANWKSKTKELVRAKSDTPMRTLLLQPITQLEFDATVKSWCVVTWFMDTDRDKWVDTLTTFHKFWVNVLLILVGVHVLAAIVYLVWKRQNLIGAMIHGHKPLDDVVHPGRPAPTLYFASGRLAISLLIACAAIVYFIVR